VGLAPTHAAVARTPRGFAPRTTFERLDGPGLDAVLAREPKVPVRLTVVLSNHFVRYALLPASKALAAPAEWSAFAAHAFESVHGREARGWTHVLARAPRGHARIAAAIDTDFLESIRTAVARHPHMRLLSVQPYLAGAFDRMRAKLGRAPAWLALVEPGRAVIALVESGRWVTVRARGLGPDWAADLRTAIAREEAFLGRPAATERVLVVSDADASGAAPAPGEPRFADLTLRAGTAPDARTCALAIA